MGVENRNENDKGEDDTITCFSNSEGEETESKSVSGSDALSENINEKETDLDNDVKAVVDKYVIDQDPTGSNGKERAYDEENQKYDDGCKGKDVKLEVPQGHEGMAGDHPEIRVPRGLEDMLTDDDLPQPLPDVPTVALRRHNGRRIPDVVPGAFNMGGTSRSEDNTETIQTETNNHTAQQGTVSSQAANARVEEGELVTGDTGVIGGAYLVAPDEELGTGSSEDVVGDVENQPSSGGEEVIVGEILEEKSRGRIPSRLFWPVAILLFTIAVVAVIVFVVVAGGEGGSPSDGTAKNQSGPEEHVIYPPFVDGLPALTRKQMEKIGTDIYYANKWMVQDPNLHTYSQTRQYQRYIMAALYYSTQGQNWYNSDGWMSYDVHECEWYSNTVEEELKDKPVCDEDENLLMLNLANNNLQGELADMTPFHSIPFLPHLKTIDVANNNITGPTPALFDGVTVEVVVLSNNSFDVISPAQGRAGESIRILKIDNNRIKMTASGVAWYLFPKLEVYNVTGNLIGGILGPQIKTARNLTYIGAGHNPWSNIPSEIGLLTHLLELDLSGNANMGGTIPAELGLLPNLRKVDLTGSIMTGDLPKEFCQPQQDGTMIEILANCSMVNCCE